MCYEASVTYFEVMLKGMKKNVDPVSLKEKELGNDWFQPLLHNMVRHIQGKIKQ